MTRDRRDSIVTGAVFVAGGLTLLFLLFGCATAPPPPAMPPRVDVETLVPPAAPPVDVSKLTRYPDVVLDDGSCSLPLGVLVSPAAYAEGVELLSERRRLDAENVALRSLRREERDAADSLQRAATALANEDARQRTLRPWLIAGGFIIGVLAGGWAAKR
jgi:hypothetical protein